MRYYAVISIVFLCGGYFGYVISEIKNKKKQQCMSCECDLEKGEAIVQCAECACVPLEKQVK